MNGIGLKNLTNFPKLPQLSIVKKIFLYNFSYSLNYQIMN